MNISDYDDNQDRHDSGRVMKPDSTAMYKVKEHIDIPSSINGLDIMYDYQDVDICVLSHLKKEKAFYDDMRELHVVAEPENAYDKNAIAVYCEDIKIGYLYKGSLQEMTGDWLKRGDPIYCHYMGINPVTGRLKMQMTFYGAGMSSQRFFADRIEAKTYKLTGTSSKSAQDALDMCSEGEEFFVDESESGNGYIITNSQLERIGSLPKAAVALVNELGRYNCRVIIDKLDYTSDMKTECYVRIEKN